MSATTAAVPTATRVSTLPFRSLLVLAGPVLVLASELAAPRQPDGLSDRAEAAFMLAHAERFLASGLLGLLAAAALIGGFTTVAQRISGRGKTLVRIGAVLGTFGALGLASHMATTLAGRDILIDDPTAYAATAAASNGTFAVIAIIALIFGVNLAMVVLGAAARRARLAGWWVVACGVLALLSDFAPTSYNTVLWAVFATAVMVPFARAVAADRG